MLSHLGYGVGGGTFSQGIIDEANLNANYHLQDSTIRGAIQAEIDNGWLQAPTSNRLYIVYVEPGVAVMDQSGATSLSDFLGYHGAFAGHDGLGYPASIRYAVIPYPGAATGGQTANGLDTFDSLTCVTSHEFAAALTDPDVNYRQLGWYDDNLNEEIADITEGHYTYLNAGNAQYAVQYIANKQDVPINPNDTTNTGPGSGTTHTEVVLLVLGDGELYQVDATGAHFICGDVLLASVTYIDPIVAIGSSRFPRVLRFP
jgi:hypothetical protein